MEYKSKYLVLLVAAMMMWPLMVSADGLDDILTGKYNAKTLSEAEIDSVLNGVAEVEASALASLGRYRLEYENREQLFRHSWKADCYIVDTQKKGARWKLTEGKVRDVQFSPNGKYIVYAKEDNNLYIYKLDYKSEVAITHDGYDALERDKYIGNSIYNGISDWLYEEEFGATAMYEFSPDSKSVAYVRLKTRTKMTPLFGGTAYTTDSIPYVFAGGENPAATVCVYDIASKAIKEMRLDEKKDAYLPRIRWTNIVENSKYGAKTVNEPMLMVLRLNRDQNEEEVWECNAKSAVSRLWYKETSRTFCVNYELFDEWIWLADNRVILLSEKSGWKQAYLYSATGLEQKQLTRDGMDITALYGYDDATKQLYYQAAPTPETRQCYVVNVAKGLGAQLTTGEGTHSLWLSDDMKRYVECNHSVDMPHVYTTGKVENGKLKEEKVVLDNAELAAEWQAADYPEKKFFSFTTAQGVELRGWMLRPDNRKQVAGNRYPVVITQYSGPSSQRVLNGWRKRFEYALAQEGYIVVCVDPRGTDCRGTKWRAETYMQLGEKEAADQLALAQYMAKQKDVDASRIAMIGWSYGGFQVIRTLEEQGAIQRTKNTAALISKGVAIAPVTDWRLYDSAYTERWMRRPEVNEGGYNAADLTRRAADLKGKLLLVHGMADDNVHVQHTMRMAEALNEAGVDYTMQIYPGDNHFLRKGRHYRDLHERILNFLAR